MISRLSNHDVLTATDPLERAEDPYREFRDIVRIGRDLGVSTRHSLGKSSHFFVALAEGRLLASRCPQCAKVWLPPRAVCPDDLSITTWTELPGSGTLVSWTALAAPRNPADPAPPLLAYLALDGAGTLLLHHLRGADPGALRHGLPVRIAYGSEPVDHPLELCWFELA